MKSATTATLALTLAIIAGLALGIAIAWLTRGGPSVPGLEQDVAGEAGASIGDRRPDFMHAGVKGELWRASDFDGRPTLVNFWATWCAPCRAEMPELEALQRDYGDKGFTVATINLDVGDDGLAKAQKFMDEENLSLLPLHRDPTFDAFEVLKKRGVALGLPATLILGPDGCEWGVLAGPAAWHSEDAKAFVETALALRE